MAGTCHHIQGHSQKFFSDGGVEVMEREKFCQKEYLLPVKYFKGGGVGMGSRYPFNII